MKIAVAGGSGTVGTHVVRHAQAAGHEAIVLARSHGVDLVSGHGLDLDGVDAVIDVSGTSTTSAAKSRAFFEAVTRHLLDAAQVARVRHHVALSIVGAANAPHGYYAGKALQEQLLHDSSVPWSVLRATQFFEFAEQNAMSLFGLTVVPAMRSQPLAAALVAAELVRVAEAGVAGESAGVLPDLAGPAEMRMAEVARAIFAKTGERRRVVELPLPGGFGRALRDGSILPGADAKIVGPSLEEWLAETRR
ncbi:MAG: NAD-dependent epimerase/dehydratase family protein [Actinobacteria bacterium]|nr:NAD-dependent epimerase/dehydratase family protein [Actinomycetota bacterium]